MTANRGKKKEIILNEDEHRLLERYKFIDDQFRRHRPAFSRKQIVNMVCDRYLISERQAYMDIQMAQRFFGTLSKDDKDYMVNVQVEWYRQMRSIAEAAGEYMAAIRASERIDVLLGLMDKKEEDSLPPPQQINLLVAAGDKQAVINIDHLQKVKDKDFDAIIDTNEPSMPSPNDLANEIDQMQDEHE